MTAGTISLAIQVLCNSPNCTDDELIQKLIEMGVEKVYATKLVLFVPAVYARLILGSLGVRFSEYFCVHRAGRSSKEVLLLSDPVWVEIGKSAESNISTLSRSERLSVAGRSAEFDVINKALNSGADVRNQVLSPLVVWYPEDHHEG